MKGLKSPAPAAEASFAPLRTVLVALMVVAALGAGALLAVAAPAAAGSAASATAKAQPVPARTPSAAVDYGRDGRAAPSLAGGVRRSPLDALVRAAEKPRLLPLVTLPSSYDLRTQNRVSPVRSQNPYGTCWTFATYGSLESCLRPGEEWDFSENNLAWFSGFDYEPYNGGGNYWMSTAYLVRWDGPVTEADDPYKSSTHPAPSTLSKAKHVQDVLILPGKQGASCAAIKEALMTHGAVATYMHASGIGDYMKGNAYYCPAGSSVRMDHAVDIVGWDDSYPAGNFPTAPPGDGAFIVRNSWGSGWGAGGYFYASYYDKLIGVDAWCFAGAVEPGRYDDIYQYDPLGATNFYDYGVSTVWLANAFTARATGGIDAVSVYTLFSGVAYQVLAGPTPQTMTVHGSGTLATAGYHTVALSTPLAVTEGQAFAVGVKLVAGSGQTDLIPVEMPVPGSSKAQASPGQSYFSLNGSAWYDATSKLNANANICVKAFANVGEPAPGPVIDALLPASGTAGDAVTLRGSGLGTSGTVRFGTTTASTSGWTSSSIVCTVPAGLDPGPVTVTVETGEKTSNGVTFTVTGDAADTTPPITVMRCRDDLTRWHNHDVTLAFAVTDEQSGPDVLLYSLDGVVWDEMDLALYDSLVVSAEPDHSWDGEWTLLYKARDRARNVEDPQSAAVRIDTRRPKGKPLSAVTVRRGRYATLRYTITDAGPHGPRATGVRVSILGRSGKIVKRFKLGKRTVNRVYKLRFICRLPRGVYRYRVTAIDAAGNPARAGSNRLTVK